MPIGVTTIPNLKILHLSHNRLQTIPYQIEALTKLEELYLTNNVLTYLPYEIHTLQHLKWLDLTHNPIQEEKIYLLKKWLPNCRIKVGQHENITIL